MGPVGYTRRMGDKVTCGDKRDFLHSYFSPEHFQGESVLDVEALEALSSEGEADLASDTWSRCRSEDFVSGDGGGAHSAYSDSDSGETEVDAFIGEKT